jgi:polyvinyl alcohol dehydrogenase (cytochrome)
VARYLGNGAEAPPPPQSAFCKADRPIMSGAARDSWAGWSSAPENTRFQTAEAAGLKAADVPKLELKWAYAFAGDVTAFGAPTILNGTLITGSAGGVVQALDAKTGCLYWLYQANGPVRSGMAVSAENGQTTLVFSDQNGWVHGVDARSGKGRWKKRVEEHEATRLTGTPAVHDGVAVHSRRVLGRNPLDRSGLSVLHLPRQHYRRACPRWRPVWKTYLVDAPKQTGKTSVGTPTLRTVRRGRVVAARPSMRAAAFSTSPPATITRTPQPRRATRSWRSTSRRGASRGPSRQHPPTSTIPRAGPKA